MPACEWCWARAYVRELGDTSKSQAEHYEEIRREQDELGERALCPLALRRFIKGRPRMPKPGDLRVWWIPQVPMEAFHVSVPTKAEGHRLIKTLALYDIFQYDHSIKPDYYNAGGLHVYEDGEWVDVEDEDA